MKRFGGLFKQVVAFDNLYRSAKQALKGKKSQNEVATFLFNLETELLTLESELRAGTYRPSCYVSFWVSDPKRRRICAAPIRDRVVHHAICNIIGPILDGALMHHSYACRTGRGTHLAVKTAQEWSRKWPFYLQLDIRKYFDSVDHQILKNLLRTKLKDAPLLALLDHIIDKPIPGAGEGRGLAIGNLTSQHFANFYLSSADHFIKQELRVKGYLRYMDDFLLFGDKKPELWSYQETLRNFLGQNLAMSLKPGLGVGPVTQGIPFLGVCIFPQLVRMSRQSWVRFTRLWRKRQQQLENGSLELEDHLRSANSLIGHARFANTRSLRRSFFYGLGQ